MISRSNEKNVDDSSRDAFVFKFNQSLQNYLKNSFAYDAYNLTNYDRRKVRDTIFRKNWERSQTSFTKMDFKMYWQKLTVEG